MNLLIRGTQLSLSQKKKKIHYIFPFFVVVLTNVFVCIPFPFQQKSVTKVASLLNAAKTLEELLFMAPWHV